jgi:SH3 domain protein
MLTHKFFIKGKNEEKSTKGRIMKKHLFCSLSFIVLILFFSFSAGWTAYITDSWKFNFRSGPGYDYRIPAQVQSGQEVQVLERRGKWTRIQLSNGKQGWVTSEAIMDRIPWEAQAIALEKEKEALKQRYVNFEENWDNLTTQKEELEGKVQASTGALEKLKTEYENLKRGSTNYLSLKKDYDIVKTALAKELEKSKTLEQENNELRSSENFKRSAIIAMWLFLGFLIGMLVGRGRKKTRQSLY